MGVIAFWCIIGSFDHSHGYFEYRYQCEIQNNTRITITLKPSTSSKPCLTYIKTLDQNARSYSEQIKQAQVHIAQWEFIDYRQSYIDNIQPKLLQSRILHRQIIKAMTKFEQDLFQKTMVYLNYRYRTTRKNLEQYINMREIAIINATDAGESEDLKKIIQKHNTEKRKFEILKLMLKATNFNELMPFYELYKQTLK
jgi:hypothetical protein